MSTVCQSPLQKAMSLKELYIRESQKIKDEALQEFFIRQPQIEEVTISSQILDGQYSSHLEIVIPKCRVKPCGCLIPIPVLTIQDTQLYNDIGELLLTLYQLKGVLVDGSLTFCRLNHVP